MSKHIYWFALAAAGLFAAACSDNDALDSSSAVSDGSSTYMAVNIYMSSDAATRSSSTVSSDGYESGTAAEYAINFDKSIFLFYASDGSYLTYAIKTTTGEASTTTSSTSDYVEYTYGTVLVLAPTTLTPSYMVGVFNDANAESYKGMSLNELQAKLFNDTDNDDDEVTVTVNETESTALLMSNAVKYDGSSFSFATEVSEENICETDAKALASPVKMYVERAKARVKIGIASSSSFTSDESAGTYTYTIKKTGTNSETDSTFTYYYVDETTGELASVPDATVVITINGWAVNAYNTTGYVIKNYTNGSTELSSDITSDSKGGAWGENWYSDFRIFWAVDGNYGTDNTDDESWDLSYYSWADVEEGGCSTDAAYYYEQTLNPNVTEGYSGGQTAYAPALLVAATVSVNASSSDDETTTEAKTRADDDNSSEDSGDIYLSYGSVLYSEDAIYVKILSLLKEAGYTGDETISSIKWETQEASKGTVTIKSITMSDNNTVVSSYIEKVNSRDFISASDESGSTEYYLRKYQGGASYYQVPIQTYISTSSTTGHPYGLVRNTAYSITINSVTGIGAGVPNTDEDLTDIPEEDETGSIAANINILAWKLSSQTVDL